MQLFDISDDCHLENGSVMSGEEIILRGFYELVTGESHNSIAENVFGRDFTQQSRAFKYFINYIYHKYLYLVTDNLQWWYDSGYMKKSLHAIEVKLR